MTNNTGTMLSIDKCIQGNPMIVSNRDDHGRKVDRIRTELLVANPKAKLLMKCQKTHKVNKRN